MNSPKSLYGHDVCEHSPGPRIHFVNEDISMILKRLLACLTLLSCFTIASIPANADLVTTGPVTIDGPAPLGDGYYDPVSNFFSLYMVGVSGYGSNGVPDFKLGSTSFAFDLAPGWSLGNERMMNDNIDYGIVPGRDNPDGDWSAAFFQLVILCPSSSPVSCTSGTLLKTIYGATTIPDQILNPSGYAAGPGTGLYAYGVYARYTSFTSAPHGPASFGFNLIPPVPEPSTFVMIGSGAFGLLGMVRRRCYPSA